MSDAESRPPPDQAAESHNELPVAPPDQPFGLPTPARDSTAAPPAPVSSNGRTGLRTHVIWLVIAALLAVGVGAASYAAGLHHSRAEAASKTSAIQPGRSCSGSSPAPTAETALLQKIVPRPADATPQSGANAVRVLSFGQVVKELYSGAPSIVPVLRAFCIEFMAQGGWQIPNEQVFIYLVQTGSPVDAQGYELFTSALLSNVPNTVNSTVPGGVYFGRAGVNSVGRAEVQELGVRGSVVVVVTILTPAVHLVSTGAASAILKEQAARLPA